MNNARIQRHLVGITAGALAFTTALSGCVPASGGAGGGASTTVPSTVAPTSITTTSTTTSTTTVTTVPVNDLTIDPILSLEPAAQPPAVVGPSISAGRIARTPGGDGYWVVQSNGSVNAFGSAKNLGAASIGSNTAVAITPTSTGNGYWIVASDGGVFCFGDAQFYGSQGGKPLNKPVVSMAPTHSGRGYWLVASDGGIFSFGDAQFYGSMGGKALNKPIVAMAATKSGNGYWLVGADGGVFTFGDAQFLGGLGGKPLNQPIVAMAPTASGNGYWMSASDGGVFAFGDAQFYGSMGGKPLNQPVIGITPTPTSGGYWLVAGDGGIFTFGDANYYGNDLSAATSTQRNRIVEIARTQIGISEPGNNIIPGNPYSSNPQSWCSSFLSWVWRTAGVSMPRYPFSGNVYTWARANTVVRPIGSTPKIGDAILVGTGPANVDTSSHIALVVGVSGNKIQTIGGNETNAVRMTTWFVPSASKYYGYASPIAD